MGNDELEERKFALDVKHLRDKMERLCRGKPVTVGITAAFSLLDLFYITYCVKPDKVEQIVKDFDVIGDPPVVINVPTDEDREIMLDCFVREFNVLLSLVRYCDIAEGT